MLLVRVKSHAINSRPTAGFGDRELAERARRVSVLNDVMMMMKIGFIVMVQWRRPSLLFWIN
jgi:hypothetical protein